MFRAQKLHEHAGQIEQEEKEGDEETINAALGIS
jgi:hypothetical protein